MREADQTAQSRLLRIDAFHLITLCTIIFAQRSLSTEARKAWFFVPEGAHPLDLLVLALGVCLLLAPVLNLFEWLVQLFSARLRNIVHVILILALGVTFAYQTLSRLMTVPFAARLIMSWIIGVAAALLYVDAYPVRLFLTYMSIAVIVIPGNFLLHTDMMRIVLLGAAPGSAAVQAGNPTPVVIFVFDEFPLVSLLDDQDQIDPNRYPNFASMAQNAYLFRDATTVADYTYNAVPAILTGQYPNTDLLPTAQDHPHNLFTLIPPLLLSDAQRISYKIVGFDPRNRSATVMRERPPDRYHGTREILVVRRNWQTRNEAHPQ